MKRFQIGNIEIGTSKQPLVIPEIGINHNGDLEVAKKMVDAAKRAGARLIKHQTHIVWDEMDEKESRKIIPGHADVSIYEIMEQCALSEEEETELKRYTQEQGLQFISTPFSRAAADRLEKMGVQAYKIGSGELNNYPLIEHVCEFGKPMIVSTGMNNIASVSKTVNIMEKHGIKYALLHTTNLYPTKPEWVRLGAMQELMREFPEIPVGLSDHTINNYACIAAMALGAVILERHFTDTMNRTGPDIACSMDENGLSDLLQAAAEVPEMLGGNKEALPEEKGTSDFAFASVVAIKEISKGEIFSLDNVWVRRPGTGQLLAERLQDVLGKRAKRNIHADDQLNESDI